MNTPDSQQPQTGRKSNSDVSADVTQFMTSDTNSTTPSGMNSQPEAWIGKQLGKYTITEKIGIGGMGVVFKVHDSPSCRLWRHPE